MKLISAVILFFLPFFGFSQTKKDYTQIIKAVIDKRDDSSERVYYLFENKQLIEELGKYYSQQESKFLTYYTLFKDSLEAVDKDWMFNNLGSTDTFSYFGVLLNYPEAIEVCRKLANERIRPYCKLKFIKNEKDLPLVFISAPVFSVDGKKAVIHYQSICGFYCGGEEFLIFSKINNHWKRTGHGTTVLH